eukprot:GEZU01019757.1.p1 GENE.GEZU01019757.1~~GEZU01019757.1.p1  ORF type:complete len:355 (+),score=32.41 GEZU01019757.1:43-1065(+)
MAEPTSVTFITLCAAAISFMTAYTAILALLIVIRRKYQPLKARGALVTLIMLGANLFNVVITSARAIADHTGTGSGFPCFLAFVAGAIAVPLYVVPILLHGLRIILIFRMNALKEHLYSNLRRFKFIKALLSNWFLFALYVLLMMICLGFALLTVISNEVRRTSSCNRQQAPSWIKHIFIIPSVVGPVALIAVAVAVLILRVRDVYYLSVELIVLAIITLVCAAAIGGFGASPNPSVQEVGRGASIFFFAVVLDSLFVLRPCIQTFIWEVHDRKRPSVQCNNNNNNTTSSSAASAAEWSIERVLCKPVQPTHANRNTASCATRSRTSCSTRTSCASRLSQ